MLDWSNAFETNIRKSSAKKKQMTNRNTKKNTGEFNVKKN